MEFVQRPEQNGKRAHITFWVAPSRMVSHSIGQPTAAVPPRVGVQEEYNTVDWRPMHANKYDLFNLANKGTNDHLIRIMNS